ncbi:ATP-binding protein [uncultured Desulfobacter sp.]|uniref:PAS domain-containing hybrid sensor histidine kinase/response regulator n=1 Tax=uncultured Desulfobacter sp. TaxID=240139 RepID=UPI002AABC42E|nr:ATP-binding protein [uncultured Desulfobacter sp.]
MEEETIFADNAKLRRFAEKTLEETAIDNDDLSEKSPENIASMVHELRVHQIELEMQNEELRRIQGELEKTQNRYSHLYDFSPVGYFSISEKGVIKEANLTISSMLKRDRGALIGKPLTQFVLKDDQDIYYKCKQHLLKTEAPQVCELRLLSDNRHEFHARLECLIITTKDDSMGEIRIAVSDVTELKLKENELRNSRHKFMSMVENIGIGVSLISSRMEVLELNRQMRKWFPAVDTATRPICFKVYNDPPGDTVCGWCPTHKTLQDGKVHKSTTSTPTASGIRNYRITSSPIVDSEGKITAAIEMVDDITEQLYLEKQLHQAQKMESIGNLAGGIAHDFNNILFSVIGFTELALDEAAKGSTMEDSLQEVHAAGKRAKELVSQILSFARKSNEEIKPVNLGKIVRESLKLIRSSVPSDIEIRKIIDSSSLVLGNSTLLQQVLMNLAINATDSMEANGGILDVCVSDVTVDQSFAEKHDLPGPDDYVKITVSDTGRGIPPDKIQLIFEPYYTTKDLGKGTGLGLASVYGTVKKYGGTITVESQPDQGTVFTILLPVSGKENAVQPYQPEALPRGVEKILFVDDELPIVKMGQQVLERLGYEVTTKTSSIEALELFQEKPNEFDLVITDMTMPDLTGEKLAVELMKVRRNIPVIICTGYSKKISDEKASEFGIKAFAYKPMVKSDLAKTVRKVLDDAKG